MGRHSSAVMHLHALVIQSLCRCHTSLSSIVALQTALRDILCCGSAGHHNVFTWLVLCDRCKHHAVRLLSVFLQGCSLSRQHSMILSPVAFRTTLLLWHASPRSPGHIMSSSQQTGPRTLGSLGVLTAQELSLAFNVRLPRPMVLFWR